MKLRYWVLFIVLSINLAFISCNKNKSNPSFKATVTCASCPCIGCPPTNTTSSATIYTVTGKIRTFKCSSVNTGSVYLNYPSNTYASPQYTVPSTPIQANGVFTFTYSSASSYSLITISYIASGHQGIYVKQTKSVPANQNCDIGTYDFDPRSNFYVRFRSLSNTPISNVYLVDETYATHVFNPSTITPVIAGPFIDTTLVFTHDAHGGNLAQSDMMGYDPYSEGSVTELPISFNCKHNNILYSAQKNITKCNLSSNSDTLFINLP